MKKLVIQIPCYNEESSLPVALGNLPRQVEGIDTVEWLIIDDGSTDRTVEVAQEHGVDHIVRVPKNQGLANAYSLGLARSLRAGADIIVNTDADNQYCADDIPKLIKPILDGQAEIVIGERPIQDTEHFSPTKKALQRLGSWVVRVVSGTSIPDAPSGFRAVSRSAAMRLNVFSGYTYTLEMIIQAGLKGMAITSVPIRTNPELRPSKLVSSVGNYVRRSITTMFLIFLIYRPLKTFAFLAVPLLVASMAIFVRFLILFVGGHGQGHVQSLILGAILIGMGLLLLILGLLAELVAANRKLLERLNWQMLEMEDRLRSGDAK